MRISSKILALLAVAVAVFGRPFAKFLFKLNHAPPDEEVGLIPRLSSQELGAKVRGKGALVVGGTRGVGFGTALALYRAGADVTIVGRSDEGGRSAMRRLRALSDAATYPDRGEVRFLRGDLGTACDAMRLVHKLEALAATVVGHEGYEYLVTTAATFPDWSRPLQNVDGLDKCFAIAVVGRYLLYRHAGRFLRPGARVLNVLASGERLPVHLFDRAVAAGERNSSHLFENMMTFAVGNEAMLDVVLEEYNDAAEEDARDAFTLVSTHPGALKTDLHRGQGWWFDVLEAIMVTLVGRTEEDAGVHQSSVLVSDRLRRGSLTFVDSFGRGRVRDPQLEATLEENQDWLRRLLARTEAAAEGCDGDRRRNVPSVAVTPA